MEDSGHSEDLRYLEEVITELRKRETKLTELDSIIAHIDFELRQAGVHGLTGSQGAILSGDASQIRTVEAFRKRKRAELQKLKHERHELMVDIRKAQERKRMIEEDMKS